MKLKSKIREGGKIIKKYDNPKTPYQRLIDSALLTPEQTIALESEFKKLNPFQLKKELEDKLKWFFRIAEIRKKEMSEAG